MCSLHAEYFLSVLLSVQVSLINKKYQCVLKFQSAVTLYLWPVYPISYTPHFKFYCEIIYGM